MRIGKHHVSHALLANSDDTDPLTHGSNSSSSHKSFLLLVAINNDVLTFLLNPKLVRALRSSAIP